MPASSLARHSTRLPDCRRIIRQQLVLAIVAADVLDGVEQQDEGGFMGASGGSNELSFSMLSAAEMWSS